MKIGIIGAGQIGSALIRQYTKAGHQVKMANASGVEKLKPLENETNAKAVTLHKITEDIEVLGISIPTIEIPKLAKKITQNISDHTVIIDTTNYYPIRDGRIDLILSQLKRNIREVQKEVLPERRQLALQFILKQDPDRWLDWWKDCVENNRMVYETEVNQT